MTPALYNETNIQKTTGGFPHERPELRLLRARRAARCVRHRHLRAERQHADSLQGAEPPRTLHRRVQGSRQRDRQPHRRGAQRIHGRRGARGKGDSRRLPPG